MSWFFFSLSHIITVSILFIRTRLELLVDMLCLLLFGSRFHFYSFQRLFRFNFFHLSDLWSAFIFFCVNFSESNEFIVFFLLPFCIVKEVVILVYLLFVAVVVNLMLPSTISTHRTQESTYALRTQL